MRADERFRRKVYALLDGIQSDGKIDMLIGVKELIKWVPDMSERKARTLLSSWIVKDIRSEIGKLNATNEAVDTDLSPSSKMPNLGNWAPEGKVRCPDKCSEGYIEIGELGTEEWTIIKCERCNGKGYVDKGEVAE